MSSERPVPGREKKVDAFVAPSVFRRALLTLGMEASMQAAGPKRYRVRHRHWRQETLNRLRKSRALRKLQKKSRRINRLFARERGRKVG